MLRWATHLPARSGRDRRPGPRRRRRLTAKALAVSLVALVAGGCHPTPKAASADRLIGQGAERVDPSLLPRRVAFVDPKYPPNPPTFPLAVIPEKSVGPFLARHQDSVLAAYIGPGEGASRRLIGLALGADGAPLDPQLVASASEDATLMVLRPAGGEQGAYVAAWTDLTDKGERLSVIGVSALGKPRAAVPSELTRTSDDIVWVEVLPTPSGEVVVWVEEARAGGANLFSVALDPEGKPRGVPSVVVRGITGWQAIATPRGAGVAVVTRKVSPTDASRASTTIAWLELDEQARPLGAPRVVATSNQRIVDIDVAAVGGDVFFAWTRHGAPEPEVMVASIDGAGTLSPPRSVTSRSGGASLVDAVGGASGGVLAWEETAHLARGTRRLHLVPLVAGAVPESAPPGFWNGGVLDVDTAGVPEVAPLGRGYAVLARMKTCADPPVEGVPCDDPAAAPVFVRLDERFAVTETQPIFVAETQQRAPLAWSLTCDRVACFVLAAGTESPTEVRVVRLDPGIPQRWRAPLPVAPPANAPRVLAIDTLASTEVYSELAVADFKASPFLATITTESSAKNDGMLAATVAVTPLDAHGSAASGAIDLTARARPEGGVSLAGAEGAPGGAVGWVGRENGHAAVHVTRIDAAGKRTNEIQLTTAGGETSDVALTWASGGWVVAWVDTRDGNGEVYATKLDLNLRRIAREVRVTNAPGDASDVTVLTRPGKDGPVVWVAWADPRDNPREGVADVFVTRLSALDATPLGAEQRILATVPHSRSPALTGGEGGGAGVSIGWIEEAPTGADPAGASVYGAMIAELDGAGNLVREPIRTRGAGDGFPTSIALDRVGEALHVALARSTGDELFLDALTLAHGEPPHAFPLLSLEGPPSMDVSLVALRDAVYWTDQSEGATEGRVRRATVAWKR